MHNSFRKLVSGAVAFATAMTISGLGLVTANAGQLTFITADLSTTQQNRNADYLITFKVKATTSIQNIRVQFSTAPSGAATVPDSMSTASAALPVQPTIAGSAGTGWAIEKATSGTINIFNSSGSGALAESDTISFNATSILNPTLGGTECDTVVNTDTCYLRITTYSTSSDGATASGIIDTGVGSFTVMDAVTVTATVDPLLKFTVAGISSGSITTNDANVVIPGGSSGVTTTATTIPFGNLSVGSSKIGQQSLLVQTNANNGYRVYQRFVPTSGFSGGLSGLNSRLMAGTQCGSTAEPCNNIDGFSTNGSSDVAWGSPAAWASPASTTVNTYSGLLGLRTSDTDVAGFNASNRYAAPQLGGLNTSGHSVMQSSTPDNGASAVYVTYRIEVNSYQPADLYTGTMVYNVVPSY